MTEDEMKCPMCGTLGRVGAHCEECGGHLQAQASAELTAALQEAAQESASAAHAMFRRARPDVPDEPVAHLSVQHREADIFHGAGRIYAAYIASGQVTEDNESEFMARAVRSAVGLAARTAGLMTNEGDGG